MAEVKGKFISLAGSLMSLYAEAVSKADEELHRACGLRHKELDPEGWYDTRLFDVFMNHYAAASITKEGTIRALKDFKDAGLITLNGNDLKILDEKALLAISENG